MRIRATLLLLFISTIFFEINAQNQGISFEAITSKKTLGINENVRVDFVMNENGDDFTPPPFTNFQIVSGPQQSVSRSWVNGVRSFSKTYTYFLTPKRKGKVTLGQAEIVIKGEVYKTLPILLEVISAVEKPNDPNNSQ